MFKAGIYRAKIYEAGIYTGEEPVAPPLSFSRRIKNACTPNQLIRTTARFGRGMMSRTGTRMSSGRMLRIR